MSILGIIAIFLVIALLIIFLFVYRSYTDKIHTKYITDYLNNCGCSLLRKQHLRCNLSGLHTYIIEYSDSKQQKRATRCHLSIAPKLLAFDEDPRIFSVIETNSEKQLALENQRLKRELRQLNEKHE